MAILWFFYGGENHRAQKDGSRQLTFPSVQTSPRSLTIDVTKLRPSAETLSPFTGLLTGGDGPRSATRCTLARCCGRGAGERRRPRLHRHQRARDRRQQRADPRRDGLEDAAAPSRRRRRHRARGALPRVRRRRATSPARSSRSTAASRPPTSTCTSPTSDRKLRHLTALYS